MRSTPSSIQRKRRLASSLLASAIFGSALLLGTSPFTTVGAQMCDNGLSPGDLVITAWNGDAGYTAKPVVVITTTKDLTEGTQFFMTDRPIKCDSSNNCDFAPLSDTYNDGTVRFKAKTFILAGKTIAYSKHGTYFSHGNEFYQNDWAKKDWSKGNEFHLYTKGMKTDTSAQDAQTGDNIVLYCMSGSQPIFLFTVLYSDDPTKTWTPPGGDLQEGFGVGKEGKIRVKDDDSCLDRYMPDDSENVIAHYYCHGNDNQLFFYVPSTRQIKSKYNQMCLTANTNIFLSPCSSVASNQKWYVDGEQLKNEAYAQDYCADRNMGGSSNIYMYPCHGGDNQKFIFPHDFFVGGSGHGERASVNTCAPPYGPKLLLTPATFQQELELPETGWSCSCDSPSQSADYSCSSDGPLESYAWYVKEKGSNFCLDRWMPDDSENIVGYPCHGGSNQKFYYVRATKQIRCKYNHKCMTWSGAPNNNVLLSECDSNNSSQQWSQDDKDRLVVSALPGYCLDRNLGNNNIYMYPCHDNWNQKFEIQRKEFFGEYGDSCESWNEETCNSPVPFWNQNDACGLSGTTNNWERRNHWRLNRPEECGKNEVEYVNYATSPSSWRVTHGHGKDPITKVEVTDPYPFFCEPPPERLETAVYEQKQQEAIAEAVLEAELESFKKKEKRATDTLKFEEYKEAVKSFRTRRSKYFPDGVTPIPGNESPGTQVVDARVPKCFGNPMCSDLDKVLDAREKLLGTDKADLEQEVGTGENQKLKKEHPLGRDQAKGLGTF